MVRPSVRPWLANRSRFLSGGSADAIGTVASTRVQLLIRAGETRCATISPAIPRRSAASGICTDGSVVTRLRRALSAPSRARTADGGVEVMRRTLRTVASTWASSGAVRRRACCGTAEARIPRPAGGLDLPAAGTIRTMCANYCATRSRAAMMPRTLIRRDRACAIAPEHTSGGRITGCRRPCDGAVCSSC